MEHEGNYGFYPQAEPEGYMGYQSVQMGQYPVAVPHGSQSRGQLDLQSPHPIQTQYHGLIAHHHQYQVPGSGYPPSPSPPHGGLSIPASPPPPSPDMYDPLSPPLSGSDTSDGLYHGSNSSGANSPSSSRANSLVHRHVRYDPTPSPTSSVGRRRRGRSQDSDDDELALVYSTENLAHNRKEATRRQRIEAEQRRRDELRDGYAKLKDVLPLSNQKSSKVSLLDRATSHISLLEGENQALQDRVASLEQEIHRLQTLNEKLAGAGTSLEPASPGMYDGRPLSPPPEAPNARTHSASSFADTSGVVDPSEEAHQTTTPSPSDGGF